jgi:carbon dioxide concentrating mechanism protein CcmL
MFLAQVRGTVVATYKTPTLHGYPILWLQPCTFGREPDGDEFAAVDLVAAGRGEWVLYVKGREAANALADKFNPCDRTILAIVDEVTLEPARSAPPPGQRQEA